MSSSACLQPDPPISTSHDNASQSRNTYFSGAITEDVLLRAICLELQVSPDHIDLCSSFIRNGGDSISALRIAMSCQSKGITVTAAMLLGSDSVLDFLGSVLQHSHSDADLDKLCESSAHTSTTGGQITPRLKNNSGPMHCRPTRMQLSLIHAGMTVPGGSIIQYCEVYASEDIPRVKSAWKSLVSNEPIFRTYFQRANDEYRLYEGTEYHFDWVETTVSDRAAFQSAQVKHTLPPDFLGCKFSVFHLVCDTGPHQSVVVWNIHHALMDGFSSALLLNKHRRLLAGENFLAAPSYVQYIKNAFALGVLPDIDTPDFWSAYRARVEAAASELKLRPSGLPYNAIYARKDVHSTINGNALNQYSKTCGVTMAALYHAAWALTVSRYVDSDNVCFGTVLSGRSMPLQGVDSVIGLLIQTVPFQIMLRSSQKVSEFLMSVFRQGVELDEKQWSMPHRGLGDHFPSIVNIHLVEPPLTENSVGLLQDPNVSLVSNVPLRIEIYRGGNIQILYHEHCFLGKDIECLAECFARAIWALMDPNRTVHACLNALFDAETRQLYTISNCPSEKTISEKCSNETLVDLFYRTAMTFPNHVALIKGGDTMLYSRLSKLADVISCRLAPHVRAGDIVCINADRSINWIVAIYGVLRAGGVYCPLDAALPPSVRNQNFLQSGSSLLLVGSDSDKTDTPPGCRLCLSVAEMLRTDAENHQSADLTTRYSDCDTVTPTSTNAYLCFTSGSTGKPKGVLCAHKSLVAFQEDFDVRLRSRPGWRIAQVMSPAFDGSIHEIFSALSYGSTLVLQSSADPFGHLSNADSAVLTPSIASVLEPNDLPSLQVIYLVGEVVSPRVRDKWASRIDTFNMYGPTEGTCGATIKKLELEQPVTLGRPTPSSRVYVLDQQLRMTIPGVIGEIYLAGVQVSQGYINRPEETAQRFLDDCITHRPGERMYRTGDRGYWDERGDLHFYGRNDRQIKLRGFRIDLDDVEFRICNTIQDCTEAAVVCTAGELVAQLKPQGLDTYRIRKQLFEVLPAYAVPRQIFSVSSFPHTNAGKIDYGAIGEMTGNSVLCQPILGVSDMGDLVSTAWKEVLECQDIVLTSESNFVELGGHSLLQLRLADRLSSLLGYSVPLALIIRSPTLGDLVDRLANTKPSTCVIDAQKPGDGNSRLSSIQESWFRKYKFNGGSSSFNVALCFELAPGIDIQRLAAAWNNVLARHPSLRCRFLSLHDGTLEKKVLPEPPKVKMLEPVSIRSLINKQFDPEHDNLICVTITPGQLVIVASHIICDYSSLNTMLREAGHMYGGTQLSEPMTIAGPIVRLPTSTATHFWTACLGNLPTVQYSIGRLFKRRSSYSGSSQSFRIKKSKLLDLDRFLSVNTVTPHQLALAAAALSLQHTSRLIDIVLGAPYLGRKGPDMSDVVDLFLEPLPIRITLPPLENSDLHRRALPFLHAVKDSSQKALTHAMPFEDILKALGMVDEVPDNQLFDVMVSYHESFGKLCMPGVEAMPLYTWAEGAKFKLMVEFIAVSETSLVLRLEYSDECFGADEISLLGKMITQAFEMLLEDASAEKIKESLSRISLDDLDQFYGIRLDDI